MFKFASYSPKRNNSFSSYVLIFKQNYTNWQKGSRVGALGIILSLAAQIVKHNDETVSDLHTSHSLSLWFKDVERCKKHSSTLLPRKGAKWLMCSSNTPKLLFPQQWVSSNPWLLTGMILTGAMRISWQLLQFTFFSLLLYPSLSAGFSLIGIYKLCADHALPPRDIPQCPLGITEYSFLSQSCFPCLPQ
jgi:hypothetical protein